MSQLRVKMAVTREYNKRAGEEIAHAGRPQIEGGFGVDPVLVWGVSEVEIDEFIAAAQLEAKRAPWWTRSGRRRRCAAWRSEMAWKCRRAAAHYCHVEWR